MRVEKVEVHVLPTRGQHVANAVINPMTSHLLIRVETTPGLIVIGCK